MAAFPSWQSLGGALSLRWLILGMLVGLIVPIGSTALAFHGPTGCELHEGTDGPDVITTHFNCDHVFAKAGVDLVFTDGGRDGIHGDADGDDLNGNELNDTIHGDGGNDELHGGSGTDVCRGGAGADSFFGCEDAQ